MSKFSPDDQAAAWHVNRDPLDRRAPPIGTTRQYHTDERGPKHHLELKTTHTSLNEQTDG
jgi:hypothetical protein